MENYKNGEDEFVLSDDNSLILKITFRITKEGQITYDIPTIL